MFQRIHVELHRVATSICLKDARQRRGVAVGKVPVYQEAVPVSFCRQSPARTVRKSSFADRTNPFAQRFTQTRRLLFCWTRSYSMSGTPFCERRDPRDKRAIMRRPRLQLHLPVGVVQTVAARLSVLKMTPSST